MKISDWGVVSLICLLNPTCQRGCTLVQGLASADVIGRERENNKGTENNRRDGEALEEIAYL